MVSDKVSSFSLPSYGAFSLAAVILGLLTGNYDINIDNGLQTQASKQLMVKLSNPPERVSLET